MKTYFILSSLIFTCTLILFSCENSDKSKELELREKELELKELELKQNENQNSYNSTKYQNNSINSESQNNSNKTNVTSQKTTSDLRDELYEKEKKRPKDYLSVDYDLNYKVLSGKDEIIGTIYNNATTATFKDIVLTVKYFTSTDTELYKENFIVYEYVYPGSSSSFNLKTYSPEGTKKIGVYVKSATGE